MTVTASGKSLMNIAKDAGLTPYDMIQGHPITTKLARYRTRTGNPIVIQINNKVARVWVLTKHLTTPLRSLGSGKSYAATDPRHHHLNQVREFRDQPLTQIVVQTSDIPTIRAAFSVC